MKVAPGIRTNKWGFEAYVRVHGLLKSKQFPPDADRKTMLRWRELQRVTAHYGLTQPVTAGRTFSDDVRQYLTLVGSMPTYADREYRMQRWTDLFGSRDRNGITPLEIRGALEQWRLTGRVNGKGLSPASLNLRRTALLHFYTLLNGRDRHNPVRAVPPYREVEPVWRLPTLEQAERAITAVARIRTTKTQLRLRVLMCTGWPSAVLKQLRREDLDWKKGTALVHGRRKGKGTPPRTVPLSGQAIRAFRAFDKANAYGPFSGSSLHSALQRGCARAKVRPFRVYDLRHLWITTVVAASADERGASELALHADPRQTRRYSRQAASERAKAALSAAFPLQPAPTSHRGSERARRASRRLVGRRRKSAST